MEATEVFVPSRVVNVASVPQRSPFRYPGGKTWLIPYVRLWLRSLGVPARELIEPFAGGAIVGLTAAFEGLASRVTLVELDSDIAAVWKTILGRDGSWLASRIVNFEVAPQPVRKILASGPRSKKERAFAAILRNRVQRGGILAPGAGLMKHGENGKGLRSRWYPETLRRRILDIIRIRDRIRFIHGDGLRYLEKNLKRNRAVFFLDPPYMVAGRRLYRHSEIDHQRLFGLAKHLRGDFLMTYDDSSEIRRLVVQSRFDCETVPMKNTHNTTMVELLIGRNLSWLRNVRSFEPASRELFAQRQPG
jgi:DNA adenine methylase